MPDNMLNMLNNNLTKTFQLCLWGINLLYRVHSSKCALLIDLSPCFRTILTVIENIAKIGWVTYKTVGFFFLIPAIKINSHLRALKINTGCVNVTKRGKRSVRKECFLWSWALAYWKVPLSTNTVHSMNTLLKDDTD